jgi:DNA-binding beta-propeller fold protein YncE
MGAEPGDLDHPMHIAIKNEKLYVTDLRNHRIQVFSLAGELLTVIGEEGSDPGQFSSPGGIAVDADGRMYVADSKNQRIQLLDANGMQIRQFGTGAGGGFVVGDTYNNRIQAFGPDGALEWMVPDHTTEQDAAHGRFRGVMAVAVDAQGNSFVADYGNDRIQKFAPDGTFLVSIGERGPEPGQFRRPTAVAIDEEGRLFTVEFGNQRVQVFEPVR